MRLTHIGVCVALALLVPVQERPLAAPSCENLASLRLPHATVTSAAAVAPGQFTPPGAESGRGMAPPLARAMAALPAFCRVAVTSAPTPDSDIKIEVWLPAAGWNGKFQAVGNGGWAGTISYPAMAAAVRGGYATASTDTGHTGNSAAFALGHPEKVIDMGYRAIHEMAVQSKAIVDRFY